MIFFWAEGSALPTLLKTKTPISDRMGDRTTSTACTLVVQTIVISALAYQFPPLSESFHSNESFWKTEMPHREEAITLGYILLRDAQNTLR